MNTRTTWRDVVVDSFAIAILFAAVALHFWDMKSAAPWIVSVVAGRWGATAMAKVALTRSRPQPPASSSPAPSSQDADEEPKSKPLPTSGIVLLLIALGGIISRAVLRDRL